ncbi:hypothetical protein BOX15_Mlig026679g1 [Macrostomum lignano]|uniref:Uncharacterized protein n=2 Tax=Macrostomum lignano TaxID=282301 RepID=A0A267GQ35_9PLAT|nr:hypothetical protein BOX15_Mlig026679g1 [Macrostomum lignano]
MKTQIVSIIKLLCLVLASDIFALEYTYTDLPSLTKISSDCNPNYATNNSFLAKFNLGKLKNPSEIRAMKAIFYELPSGERQGVDINSWASLEPQFQAPGFQPNRRHIGFLTVRLADENSTSGLTDWLWSQKFEFTSCGVENRSAVCLCDPVNSYNGTECRPGSPDCRCTPQATSSDCSLCTDGTYRDYSRYSLGCISCQCSPHNFAGPCAWRHVGDPDWSPGGSGGGGLSQRVCIGCRHGFVGDNCLAPRDNSGMGLAAKIFLVLACLLCSLALLAAFVILRRQCRRRAQRAARHSLAVQRLFSRFKDDTSLEAEAAESSAILAEDDDLQRATQQLRLGADPVYQPTTVSIT